MKEENLSNKPKMSEDKLRRIVTGGTVGATALVVALLAFLVPSIVTLCVQNARMQELSAEKARYEQLIEEGNAKVDYFQSDIGLGQLAFQQGFVDANKK